MKNILTILFLFWALLISAQSDSIYIETINGVKYTVNQTIEGSGVIKSTKTPVSNNSQLKDRVYNFIQGRTRVMAGYTNNVWKIDTLEDVLLEVNALLNAETGMNLFQLSTSIIDSTYVGTWQVSTDGGNTFNTAEVSRVGDLYTLTAGQNSYDFLPVGIYWLRIAGIPSASKLFRVFNTGRLEFKNLDESFIIYKQ